MPSGIYQHKSPSKETIEKIRNSNLGKKRSDIVKENMSEAHKGLVGYWRGKKRPLFSKEWKDKIIKNLVQKGEKLSKVTKEKISKILEGRKHNYHTKTEFKKGIYQGFGFKKGKEHIYWQDGKSFESYGIEFNKELREQIRQRDNYRCQECFRHQDELFTKAGRKYKLIVHHIDYNKQNNNPNNLISLCRNCHNQTNFKRENWTNYFKNIAGKGNGQPATLIKWRK